MPRFAVDQGTKIRAIDDASISGSMANLGAAMTEKLEVPSTDSNIAICKAERGAAPRDDVVAWVLDESKAYRQIAVRQDHRRYTVMASTDPSRPQVGYFVLLVHPFGLSAAFFNYNRRAALLTHFFVRECRFVVQKLSR